MYIVKVTATYKGNGIVRHGAQINVYIGNRQCRSFNTIKVKGWKTASYAEKVIKAEQEKDKAFPDWIKKYEIIEL